MDGFSQKTWKDRDVQYPGKRTLTNFEDSSDFYDVIVERAEGSTSGGDYRTGDLYRAGTTSEQGSMNNLEKRIADAFDEVYSALAVEINSIYPVGSIYQSFDSTSPAVLFPGTTWVSIKRVLLPVPTSESSGQNRGNNENTITHTPTGNCNISVAVAGALADLRNHSHGFSYKYVGSQGETNPASGSSGSLEMMYGTYTNSTSTTDNASTSECKSQLHTHPATTTSSIVLNPVTLDIRQEYVTMFCWRRTA